MADMEVSKGTGVTVEDVKALVETRVQAAIDEGKRRAAAEIAEPQGWWNLWAMGPFQVTAVGGPLLPHKVIKVGETFSVATVLWLSDAVETTPGGPIVCNLITNLGCDFVLEYCTNDMCRLQRAQQFSPGPVQVPLVPNQCFYVDVQTFQAAPGTESCIYEMNICARITGCQPGAAPQLAGFATAVYDFDPDLFYPPPGGAPTFPPAGVPPGGATPFPGVPARWEFDIPIRFQIYP